MIKKGHYPTLSQEVKENIQEPTNLLDGMKTILEFAEDSALCNEFFEDVKIPMDYLCKRLKLTPTQVTLLAIIMEIGYQRHVSMNQISNFLSISNLEILSKGSDVTTLVTRRFVVEQKSGRDTHYSVLQDVYDAFRHNEVFSFKLPKLHNDEELANEIDKMLTALDDGRMDKDIDLFDRDIRELLLANDHIRLARTLLGVLKKTNEKEFRVVLLMSMFWIRDEDIEIESRRFDIVFNRHFETRQMINMLQSGRSILVKKKLVIVSSSEGLLSNGVFSLSPQFRKSLTPDRIPQKDDEEKWNSKLTLHKDIKKKEMFYNTEAEGEVDRLQQILKPEQMTDVLARLKEKGMRGGFTCLLYGGPGTGKTETVLQLARSCGRDIFLVDVSKLRSKWYGESERLVKNVFDDYRQMVADSKVAPIMFFNEADAIFNRRMANAERSVDKGENALQNIILQEMETLNGILIATTNLQENLDSAFERRFLYKLFLDKPTTDVKTRIWQSMLPDLTEVEARQLAVEFDFSGGQIENVVRKRFIDEVLTGEKADIQAIQTLCHHEQLEKKSRQSIGFMRYAG